MTNITAELASCSFCSKHKDRVGNLIVGDGVAICNECVHLCQELLTDPEHAKTVKHKKTTQLNPREIHQHLDQYIVGQDAAKIALSVAIVNHYKRISSATRNTQIQKANILMIGPTGTGKTLLARTVAEYLDVPFVITDATTLTEAGYVGDDVENLISRLYRASGNSIERTQRGIVFLDEVDKISRKSESATISRDVSGEGVQQALLKLVEGTRCKISAGGGRKSPGSDSIEIDTTDILFVVGGAFVGLDTIVKNRVRGTAMGFGADFSTADQTDAVTPDDLVRYGLIPEFVGRFPSTVSLQSLDQAQLITILSCVKNNLVSQYQWLFGLDEVELEFEPEALTEVAQRAVANRTGARGLQSEMERVLIPHMYNLAHYREQGRLKVVIDKSQINTPMTCNGNTQ
jgi:ATP-dependent Clp protease ATP-binding subunit ClpX